ncbi:hypothetical protein Ga0100231_016765 [Opitutaceae bacterium TAV4]|nr:hypothetical protein Ga0100231_016765 [Opitutaceae bacterium TAV4]
MPTRTNPRRILAATLLSLGLGLVIPASLHAATLDWTRTAEEGEGNWSTAENWTNDTIPVTGDTIRINNGGTVLISAGTAAAGANLKLFGTASTLNVTGGTLSLTSALEISAEGNPASGVLNQSGGIITASSMRFGVSGGSRVGTYNLSGDGTLMITNTVNLGYQGHGYFTQTGGSASFGLLNIVNAVHDANTTSFTYGTYEISAGSLSTTGDLRNGAWGTSTGRGNGAATLRVVGSQATAINVGANYVTGIQKATAGASGIMGRRSSTLDVSIDNGGLTKINLTNDTASAVVVGELKAGIKGGVALTQSDKFTVLEAGTGKIATTRTDNVRTGGTTETPVMSELTSTLFSNSTLFDYAVESISDTRDALQISFKDAAGQGTLALVPDTLGELALGSGATAGFVTMSGLTAGNDVSIYLNVSLGTGKTSADLMTYFTENGIVASAIDEGAYNILVTMTAAAQSGYFAWDFSGFDINTTLVALGAYTTAVVPEPASFVFVFGLLIFAAILVRRRK